MTFEEWWLSQPLDIRKMGPSMAAVEAAWNAATKAEREACAKVVGAYAGGEIAAAIRARGEGEG